MATVHTHDDDPPAPNDEFASWDRRTLSRRLAEAIRSVEMLEAERDSLVTEVAELNAVIESNHLQYVKVAENRDYHARRAYRAEQQRDALLQQLELEAQYQSLLRDDRDSMVMEMARLIEIVDQRPAAVEHLHRDYTRAAEQLKAERSINAALRRQVQDLLDKYERS